MLSVTVTPWHSHGHGIFILATYPKGKSQPLGPLTATMAFTWALLNVVIVIVTVGVDRDRTCCKMIASCMKTSTRDATDIVTVTVTVLMIPGTRCGHGHARTVTERLFPLHQVREK